MGNRRVFLVDRHVLRLDLAVGEADAVRGLRACEDHLSGIGQIDAKVGHTWLSQRDEVAIDHAVTVVDKMPDRVPTGLATTAGEEDSHVLRWYGRRLGHRVTAAIREPSTSARRSLVLGSVH